MLFHNVLCVCFLALLAPKIETNAELEPVSERPETIFADVIRNISRVNTELQDLINNYEQFKKMQSSQEKFDEKEINDLSDTEGGQVNRNKKNIANKRVSSGTTKKYQTNMIFVGDEAEGSSQPENDSEAEKRSQSEQNSEAENNSEAEKRSQSEQNSEVENNSEAENSRQSEHNNVEDQIKKELTRSMEYINKKTRKTQKTTTEANIAEETTFERENQVYIDIHNIINTNKEPETINSEKEMPAKYHSVSDSYTEGEQLIEEEEESASKRNNRADTDENVTTAKSTAGIFLRSGTDKPKSTSQNISSELSDNDVALNKDAFKIHILREAYGDACLKLVIRKCYKACKSVLSNSCRALKCNSDLKNFFITKTKTGCIEAFNASRAKKPETDVEDTLRRDGRLNEGAVIQNGYLSMACQSEIEMPLRRKLINDTIRQTIGQVSILRDKYERACQRISQKKCQQACNKAKDATCEKFECQKRLKKNFKRNCKANCKSAYSSKSSSSSDSGSGSDSDGSSDDDSDEDSSKSSSKSKSKS